MTSAEAAAAEAGPALPAPFPERYWSAARIDLRQQLWGPGFVEPGGAKFVVDLTRQAGLSSEKNVLDVTAGLGGAARAIAETFDAWVTGLEIDPELADQAMEESVRQGLEKKAAISSFADGWPDKRYDLVFAREAFYAAPDKVGLLEALCAAVKPEGELLFTDIARTTKTAGAAYEAWRGAEPRAPDPWTMDDCVSLLSTMGMRTHAKVDISQDYVQMARGELKRHLDTLREEDQSREAVAVLADEATLWARRFAAFEAGELMAMRVFAFMPG